VVVALGIATTRPVMGVFFATRRLTHLSVSQFFGIAFWIGFSINTAVVNCGCGAYDSTARGVEGSVLFPDPREMTHV
jgi:hypothetical protein